MGTEPTLAPVSRRLHREVPFMLLFVRNSIRLQHKSVRKVPSNV